MGLGLQKLEAVGISKASCLKMRIPLRSGNYFFRNKSFLGSSISLKMRIPLRSGNILISFFPPFFLVLKFKNENSFEEWKPMRRVTIAS